MLKGSCKKTQIKTGSVCNNDGMKKPTIIGFIQNADISTQEIESRKSNNNNSAGYKFATTVYKHATKKSTPTKEFLCFELETYFRYLDLIDTKNRHFYNVEEAIEYKLNEK